MNHQSLESLTSPSCSASLDELELMWAAVERLATPQRLKTSLSRRFGNKQQHSMIDGNDQDKDQDQILTVDVTKLRTPDRQLFVDQLLQQVEVDNLRLLQKQRDRIRRLGLELPAVEVRYKNLSIEAECEAVHAKPALPTLWNTLKNILFDVTRVLGCKQKTSKICILKDISGIIKPSRMTLLLGPPGCGKTTFLQALSGITEKSLKITGEISYNGYKLNEFVPEKTSAYISQHDLHISEMTVRETLDFSARCQGTRARADIMKEVIKREKQIGVIPDPELDIYMKAVSFEGIRKSLQTDYILKILGLETCADTIAGDAMNRGISGGQKKRLTTAEMIIGPRKVLLMDEISNGLDSSTTFQIITCLQQLTSLTESTILVSLLQPAPEIFALFEDIILMSEGKIVYNGPCKNVLEFFEHCGFQCPPRKGIADFLQQVVSKMDQSKYWFNEDEPHSYISVDDFVNKFKEYSVGKELADELSRPIGKSGSHKDALSFSTYSLKSWELFKACMAREWLLMKRNRFLHIFKSSQLVIIAIITMTVFLRTRMKIDAAHSNHFLGSLFYALIRLMCNGFAELSLTSSRLSVFYKQRKFYFYPAWTYSIPSAILRIPFSLLDAFLWTSLTYYVIGYSPEPDRFFCQFLILFLVHQVSISLFRLMAALVNNQSVAIACGFFCVTVIFIFGGFVISKPSLPAWLEWGFWLSPLAYAEIGVSLNEFRASRWQKTLTSNETIGQQVLQRFGLDYANYYFWISVGALIGFLTVFNIGFNIALAYLKPAGRSYTTIARKGLSNLEDDPDGEIREKELLKNSSTVLPFEPIAISFENVKYSVDVPKELNRQGFSQKRLELLQDITGAFRPGILTALMGVSGAGKTTLMDVISGRKIGGLIEGEIIIGGYPKIQSTYARISGYCEQNDIHSPQITIQESVTYSAWLRLPPHIDRKSRSEIINEVLKMIELDVIKDALVGIAGVSGISNEQRKRLTIAVELVANPSIIFLDEPTTGLDARSAATVMRVVKNIVRARRTVVCTIHQPSIDIFEEFDEVMLMKRGGQLIYYGEIGEHSRNLIEYFEGITGVPEFREHYNPATWMLEVTSSSIEAQLGIDFALLYRESQQFQKNKELVRAISSPPSGSKDIQFSSRFPQNGWEQFKACLWKQRLSYWRSPEYNLVRLTFITICSILFGALLWQKGQTINNEQDLFNMVGSIFIFMLFTGIANCSTVQPYITSERIVFYRERFAGMYSSWAYSFAQVAVEIPYTLLQTIVFSAITYPAINFSMSGEKMIWYFYTMFCTYLYFNYFGMMLVSITSSYLLATVLASFSYTMFNLFSGYLIPKREIPKWWVWAYWICPTSWSLEGLVTSQYGDVNKSIEVFGEHKALNAFLKDYYGYHNQDLVLVAILLFIFPLAFALAFAFAIAKLNFQKR